LNTTAASLGAPQAKAKRASPRIHWPLLWTLAVAGLLYWGYYAHLERYISPQRGLGYWLGIVGGSMMVLLLIYSARKRAAWLAWLGTIPAWFEIHMTLGIVGPILVLFHSNFKLGATNSNVALICMLIVAASGVVGRYIYTRLHARLDDHELTLEQLKAVGERLRTQSSSIAFLPGLLDAIDRAERRWIEPPKAHAGRLLHLISGAPRLLFARWIVRRAIKRAVRSSVRVARPGDRAPRRTHRRSCAQLRGPPARGGSASVRVPALRAAVFTVARAAHPAVLHVVDRGDRPRDCGQRVLTHEHGEPGIRRCASSGGLDGNDTRSLRDGLRGLGGDPADAGQGHAGARQAGGRMQQLP
jgi:hypothetical protein